MPEPADVMGPAFELAPVPLSISGEDGTFWRVNAAYCRAVGYTRAELEGAPIAKLIPPDTSRAEILRLHRAFLEGEDNLPFYWAIQRKDGVLREVFLDTHRFEAADGTRYRVTYLHDVTGEREETERRRFIEHAIDNCEELIMWAYPDGRLAYVNDMAVRKLGYPRDRLMQMGILDLDCGVVNEPDQDLDQLWYHLERHGSLDLETKLRAADGSVIPVEVRATHVVFGGQAYNCSFLRDITRRKQTEEELAQQTERAQAANRAKTNFLASMSHELRTPLNAIVGFADIMERGTYGPIQPATYADYIKDIRVAGQHLLTHINNLLDLSRSAAGQYRLALQPVAAYREAETARRLAGDRRGEAPEVALHADEELPELHADPSAVRRIVLNLLDNALKFTPADGRIELSLANGPPGWVRLRVADTGPGIDPDKLAEVVEPFAQAGNAYRREDSGAGVGLALVRELARHHGGELRLDSQPGAGTTATVWLPVDGPGRSADAVGAK